MDVDDDAAMEADGPQPVQDFFGMDYDNDELPGLDWPEVHIQMADLDIGAKDDAEHGEGGQKVEEGGGKEREGEREEEEREKEEEDANVHYWRVLRGLVCLFKLNEMPRGWRGRLASCRAPQQ